MLSLFSRPRAVYTSFLQTCNRSLISSALSVPTQTFTQQFRDYTRTPSFKEKKRRLKVAIAKNLGRENPKYWEPNTVIKRDVVSFPKRYFALDIPSVLNKTKVAVFHVPLELTKPEIKAILTEYYDLPVLKVNTAIYQGKRIRTIKGFRKKRPDYKKAYVFLKDYIEIPWPEEVRREIARSRDKRLNKVYEKEQREMDKVKEEQAAKEQEAAQKEETPLLEGTQK
jgi:large subunit ribosomal protein L23